jgi:hypothetical protein
MLSLSPDSVSMVFLPDEIRFLQVILSKIPAIKKDRSQGGGERPAFGLKRMGSVSKDCAISFKWA